MKLSSQAIQDLRNKLDESFGDKFSINLSDIEVNEIGLLFLTILAEGLKLKAGNCLTS